MIRLVEPALEPALLGACALHPVTGANIFTLWRCYGNTLSDVQLWVALAGERPTAALAQMGGRLEIALDRSADLEELRGFAGSLPALHTVQAPLPLCRELADGAATAPTEYAVMVYDGPALPLDSDELPRPPSLEELYAMLAAGYPGFRGALPWESWYTHTSHLLRHGLGKALALWRDGRPVSAAAVLQRGPRCDVIGSVVTQADCRGRGYASHLVKILTNDILRAGRSPVLCCLPELTAFYERIGFRERDRLGRVSLDGSPL